MKKSILFVFVLTLSAFTTVNAQQDSTKTKRSNVFDTLQAKDSTQQSSIRFFQDKRIEQLFLDRKTVTTSGVAAGFRVQVFSSNIQQTAKNEAFRIEKMFRERFPEKGIYVTYTSPFWKVRVGDFKTRAEAKPLQDELMRAFPEMRGDIYVVPDEISLMGTK